MHVQGSGHDRWCSRKGVGRQRKKNGWTELWMDGRGRGMDRAVDRRERGGMDRVTDRNV